jgi:hypothetical protein
VRPGGVHAHLLRQREYALTLPTSHATCRSRTGGGVAFAGPHLGHLYSVVLADASYRWRQMMAKRSDDAAIFSTGTDEHGAKASEAAHSVGARTALLTLGPGSAGLAGCPSGRRAGAPVLRYHFRRLSGAATCKPRLLANGAAAATDAPSAAPALPARCRACATQPTRATRTGSEPQMRRISLPSAPFGY